jgi:hypothetical protein
MTIYWIQCDIFSSDYLPYQHITQHKKFSSTSQTESNFNRFNEKAIHEYLNNMFLVIEYLIVLMLIKYPIGMKSLPLFEKLGFNSLAGGFLDYQTIYIKSILNDEQLTFLEDISDNNPDVKKIVDEIEALSDISTEELQKQREYFDEWNKESKK